MISLTDPQQRAVAARGDVLVLAGAGAGKTRTLVARILDRVLAEAGAVSLDRILVVTFTEAAATEMRHRLQSTLEARSVASPGDPWLADQLALLDSAPISTLHAFCLRLLREHFHELELDPQFTVQDALQAAVQREETLSEVLREHLEGEDARSLAVRAMLRRHGGDDLGAARRLVLAVYDHARTLPNPGEWLGLQRQGYLTSAPDAWRVGMGEALADWAGGWREQAVQLGRLEPENFAAQESAEALAKLSRAGAPADDLVPALEAIVRAGEPDRFKRGTKGKWRDPLKELFEEAVELRSLLAPGREGKPGALEEDWTWVRDDVVALLDLVDDFATACEAARRAAAVVDFADLEQLALRLLWDGGAGRPTDLAREWQDRLELVFVDEYQDINGAQDRILRCLSREGEAANRFFVGDSKQSIYRFRRADPRIFQGYAATWRDGRGRQVLPLVENFRSHERILGFVNTLFGGLMRREVGGLDYDQDARLEFGAPEGRSAWRERPERRVEFWLHLPGEAPGEVAESGPGDRTEALEDLDAEEAQAGWVAQWMAEQHARGERVWDAGSGEWRPVAWRDMVVLHPAPRPVAERWARQFLRAGVPFEARRGGFFEALEVSDLVNLARLLDNPRQDLPLLAVLRSPLVGMSVEELAALRLARREGSLWEALEALIRGGAEGGAGPCGPGEAGEAARSRLVDFRHRFDRWRRLAREGSLSWCLEAVLAETGYEAWLRAQPRGEARLANVWQLLALTRQFDAYQRHGLYRFLRFLESQESVDQGVESAAATGSDCVRFLSVHQSKGLEFPWVAVAGLGRRFHLRDLAGDWLVDEELGICPPVVPPGRLRGYPSLPRWLAGQRQRREFTGEQVRLLYVACTRAAERLLLVGVATRGMLDRWSSAPLPLTTRDLVQASSPLGWLGPMMAQLTGRSDWASEDAGEGEWLNWRLVGRPQGDAANGAAPVREQDLPMEPVAALGRRWSVRYAFARATTEPAKAAVTGLTRRWRADEEAMPASPEAAPARVRGGSSEQAIARGLAHHLFCERVNLSAAGAPEGLASEAARLAREGWLTTEQASLLDLGGLWGFWGSELGARVRAEAEWVQRELPFTARLSMADAARLRGGVVAAGHGEEDLQVVQGVVDLAVIRPGDIWVVDFKTDRVSAAAVEERAAEYCFQLRLYAEALAGIYRRPVTERWLYFVQPRRLVAVG